MGLKRGGLKRTEKGTGLKRGRTEKGTTEKGTDLFLGLKSEKGT